MCLLQSGKQLSKMASGPLNLRSKREMRMMRRAGLLVWKAHQTVSQMIQPGVQTDEIDAAVDALYRQHDAVALFQGVPGNVPFPAVTCISVNDAIVHGIPSSRKLHEGDIVSVDTGCKVNGWCGDAAATYRVGRVDRSTERLLQTTERSLNLAVELIGNRERWSEVAREMQSLIEGAGFSVVKELVGHGIGRQMHEEPQVPNFVNEEFLKSGDFSLRPGLVLAIEPMVNMGAAGIKVLPDQWTQVTEDGQPSAHFEHTVALTSDGPWVLTGPPEDTDELGSTS